MKNKELRKLWEIKEKCKVNGCHECEYYIDKCMAVRFFEPGCLWPCNWNLPPLPEKSKLEDKFYLGDKTGEKIKINKQILKALKNGYNHITCEVSNSPVDKNDKARREIEGINIGGVYPYYDTDGDRWKNAKPVPRNMADDVEIEIGDEVEVEYIKSKEEIMKLAKEQGATIYPDGSVKFDDKRYYCWFVFEHCGRKLEDVKKRDNCCVWPPEWIEIRKESL